MFILKLFTFVFFCFAADFHHLKKLKALDLSGNGFSSSMELQGKCVRF